MTTDQGQLSVRHHRRHRWIARAIGLAAVLVLLSLTVRGALAVGSSRDLPLPASPFAQLQGRYALFPNLWRDVSETGLGPGQARRRLAQGRHRTVVLDKQVMDALVTRAPLEFSPSARLVDAMFEVPWPDGGARLFRILESPIMAPELARRFPDIRTYIGVGLDDLTASLRFDWTSAGFHGIVLSAEGTVFIDPDSPGDVQHYVSYFKRDFQRTEDVEFQCGVSSSAVARGMEDAHLSVFQPPHGTELRNYRLAVAATGEYTATKGGTVNGAMAGIVTTMNRVNGVYERDFAVRMNLVANNASLVYTNGATDPYTNNSGPTMLCENARNTDTVIGSANYDIGHVFSTLGGGIAGLGVVCNNGNACGAPAGSAKARGVTGQPSPVGDPFDIDYVAHEMGHQFGARHTFNGTTDNCGGGNRSASTAYEPGSGTTIMAYAGICGAENLQSNSDAHFHAASQTEVLSFITNPATGGSCVVPTSTGNTPPTVNAGPNYTIPKSTPFTLTAAGADIDGDALTYAWEQFNLGTASPPNTDDGTRPIFRSFPPTTSPSRTFPKLSDILNNTATIGESLATTTRALLFRVTARDNRTGGGGTASADATVNVSAGAGPFLVTQPNSGGTWPVNTTQLVTWDVANTAAVPVSTANVKILLSTDGGNTFPHTLAASTANDGSEVVTVPALSPTATARVKVEAVGNIFFDVSNANFAISAAGTLPNLVVTAFSAPGSAASGGQIAISATVTNQGTGSSGAYRLGFYFSTDAIITTADTFTGFCNMAALTPGQLQVCSGSLTVPSLASGTYYFAALADDQASVSESNEADNSASSQITVTGIPMAIYDPTLKVPTCGQPGSACDSGPTLLNGRANISGGPEPNQPNNLYAACSDGALGAYHTDESVDRIKISTLDGTPFAPGKTVKIDTTVWAFNASDRLDLYYTASVANPSWTFIATVDMTASGPVTVSRNYVLPAGGQQAVRAHFRFSGAPASCSTGSFDESDDLAFTVGGSTPIPFDFTGDFKSDIIWRHNTRGEVWLWPMNGVTPLSQNFVRTVPDTTWNIHGLGDQNGDGKADLLWRNSLTGTMVFWPMNGSTPLSETFMTSVDPGYVIVGTGDYDGDGKSDILWRHPGNGQIWIWLMNGAATLSIVHVDTIDTSYDIFGSGDLNADGKADIVWRNTTTGDVWVWLMNGTTRLSQTFVGSVPDLGYQIVGVADHTDDGKADILWRHTTQGDVWLWPMNGAALVTQSFVGAVDPIYVIKGQGDYNGDGKADIVWHRSNNGDVWVWLMNGAVRLSETYVATVPDLGYQIVKVK